MTDPVFHFGGCELHLGTRILLVNGRTQVMEPLAFDLLVYLLRHRGRDVSKDELLDDVWLGRIVTVGAVARAVMSVRKAIAAGSSEPMIRTVHRVGYRFVGDGREETHPAPDLTADAGPIRIALLPFENLTGDLSADWATIGLMALVGNALATDPHLAPLTVHDVSAGMSGLGLHASVEARVDALRTRSDARHVVHTRILRDEGGYRLDYRLLAAPGEGSGTVYAGDLIRLGRALARRLLGHLVPGGFDGTDHFALHDPWAMQLLACAMQAVSERAWRRARCMLRVVLDLEPEYDEARRELARIEALAAREPAGGAEASTAGAGGSPG
jgi:DNA-binding winged helix-turn-helix (wHTH) protein